MSCYDTPTVVDIEISEEEKKKYENETKEERKKRLAKFLEELEYSCLY